MTIRSSLFLPRPCTPFCAGRLALLFTVLFVLLAEDDSSDSKALGEQQSQFASYQWRFVGLSEKERELFMRSHSSYYGYSPVPTNVADSPASVTVTSQIKPPPAPGVPKRLFWCVSIALAPLFLDLSMCSSTVHLADTRPQRPPTSSSPTQTSSAAPMLSMAKLTVHRRVRISFFRFPFVHLTHITSRLLIAFRLVPKTP